MLASAPGKVVLSGAYVVLDGAPAVVAAVNRYATADTSRSPAFASKELQAAFGTRPCPYVDTSALRSQGKKLGLGSSAATLVAALAADHMATGRLSSAAEQASSLASTVAQEAFLAHRKAQGGGSGIDVVASAYGGVICCTVPMEGELPEHLFLPPPSSLALTLEAWVCPTRAATSTLLHPVRTFRAEAPGRYQALTAGAWKGSLQVAEGMRRGQASAVLQGVHAQYEAMVALTEVTGAPILPLYMQELHAMAAQQNNSCFFQAGAGGGDIALYLGHEPSSQHFHLEAHARGLRALPLSWGAIGVRAGLPCSNPATNRL